MVIDIRVFVFLIYERGSDMDTAIKSVYEALSRNAVVRALFENYESLYVVDAETSAFKCYHESDSYRTLSIESQGEDFFYTLENNIIKAIYWEDQEFVKSKLSKQALMDGLSCDKFYSFVYRLIIDGKPLYHKLRATVDSVNGRPHFLIGIRNVDASFRQDKALAEKLTSMHSKEINRLEAILSSAEGYIEADLTNDRIVGFQPYKVEKVPQKMYRSFKEGKLSYSDFLSVHMAHMVESDIPKFKKISDRGYLLDCFTSVEKRASVTFSMKRHDGNPKPFKLFFYLYRDASTEDIMAFAVLYDLTEQLRREKELKDLENELQMSKLRNFTSQMQPHFLYNALGSIQEVMLEDPQYASELLGDFTAHLRSCIRSMTSDAPIPFAQELSNIKAYVNIEKMRLGKKLKMDYDIETCDFLILPLSIQPIVENAIRHGVYPKGEEGGTVTLRTRQEDGRILVIVEDDGVGFDVEEFRERLRSGKTDSAGLKNISFRLDRMLQASLDIESRKGEGTKVTISIPKGENNESDNSR